MKKRVLVGIFIISLFFSLSLVLAEENETVDSSVEKIDNAYKCLTNKIVGKCSSLALEEKIFSVMATGECKTELLADSLSRQCWPSSRCTLKATAQAILALDKTTQGTIEAEKWLLSQNASPPDVEWYLQIESTERAVCSVTYDGIPHQIILEEDKTLTTKSSLGTCLTRSSGDWWLKVSPTCYGRKFEISCDKGFQTNLLFKLKTSSILHLSDKVAFSSANGKTEEQIKSACFIEGGRCNYEGSLWAALILNHKGYDISAHMPYLSTMAEENPKFLPEAFLYALNAQDDYRNNLLIRQKADKYWDETGDKFYDSSVALYSISDEPIEKTNTKNWLLEIQGSDGCWQGIRNTAFILASIWPRQINPSAVDCENSGYYCMSEISCEGDILLDYDCPRMLKCCDTPGVVKTCEEQTGEVCISGQNCNGGLIVEASDVTGIGEKCCIGGTCEEAESLSECEPLFGICTNTCEKGEVENNNYECSFSGDVCCVEGEEESSYWWIWFLVILIILTLVGIKYKEKLRPYWNKLKPYWDKIVSKFTKKKPGLPLQRQSRASSPMIARRPIQRRILPSPTRRAPPIRRPQKKKPGEIDEVLKKLKEMSK